MVVKFFDDIYATDCSERYLKWRQINKCPYANLYFTAATVETAAAFLFAGVGMLAWSCCALVVAKR